MQRFRSSLSAKWLVLDSPPPRTAPGRREQLARRKTTASGPLVWNPHPEMLECGIQTRQVGVWISDIEFSLAENLITERLDYVIYKVEPNQDKMD